MPMMRSPRALQQSRDDGAIHSARHRDGDERVSGTELQVGASLRRCATDSATRIDQRIHLLVGIGAAERKAQARRGPVRGDSPWRAARATVRPRRSNRPRRSIPRIPCRSSAISSASPSMPSKRILVVFGTRGDRGAVDAGSRECGRECPAPGDRAARRCRAIRRRRSLATSVRGQPERDGARDILGTRAALALVTSAELNRLQRRIALADVQRADALGRVHLVPADRVQVDAQRRSRRSGSCPPPARRRSGARRRPRARCARSLRSAEWSRVRCWRA